jgi:hypothetical protein
MILDTDEKGNVSLEFSHWNVDNINSNFKDIYPGD